MQKTKVYEYYERPMSCKIFPIYGRTVKRSRETRATCARCSSQGHKKVKCTSPAVRCSHCGVDHQALSRNCPLFKREEEIVQIQTKEHIHRLQLIRKLHRLNQNPELLFSNAVRNTPNPTTSKYQTRSEHESQFDFSEDNSPTVYRPRPTDATLRGKEKKEATLPTAFCR